MPSRLLSLSQLARSRGGPAWSWPGPTVGTQFNIIHRLVNPAPLLAGATVNLFQRRPESHRTVPDRQLRCIHPAQPQCSATPSRQICVDSTCAVLNRQESASRLAHSHRPPPTHTASYASVPSVRCTHRPPTHRPIGLLIQSFVAPAPVLLSPIPASGATPMLADRPFACAPTRDLQSRSHLATRDPLQIQPWQCRLQGSCLSHIPRYQR